MKYQIRSKSKQHYEAILTALFALGFNFEENIQTVAQINERGWGFKSYPVILIGNRGSNIKRLCGGTGTSSWSEFQNITLDDFLALPEPVIIYVVLNNSYTAEVSKQSVKVGCQEFPLSVIPQLMEAYNKVK